MELEKEIVIVNEYSVPLPPSRKGGDPRGSRGSTPGAYVLRYMAREAATETVAPIRRHHTDHFTKRYIARESLLTNADIEDIAQLKNHISYAQGLGGVAFGYSGASLSHEQLKAVAAEVQYLFEDGHTVMKTVVSFTQEYLKGRRLIPDNFEFSQRSGYWDQVDQMKLRMALMHGLNRMGQANYDELRYVGVIQVDTENVHCHLAMVDAGRGTRVADGTQKGKISRYSRFLLRRGIDSFLHQKQHVAHLPSASDYEKRNVATFTKRWAHRQLLREVLPQFLLTCLPEDRKLWRLTAKQSEMRKPNQIVREIVKDLLTDPASQMAEVTGKIRTYADHQSQVPAARMSQQQALMERDHEQIIEQGAAAVYSLLRNLPQSALVIRTPILDIMGMNYEELAIRAHEGSHPDSDLVNFGFRLRSYSTRLNHHIIKRKQAHRRVREWEAADSAGKASPSSRVVHRFWQVEEEYHARVAAKYRSLLPFASSAVNWRDSWERLVALEERLLLLESMRYNQFLRKVKGLDETEKIGRESYNREGGRSVAMGDSISLDRLDKRIHMIRTEYSRKFMNLRVELAGQGLVLKVTRNRHGKVLSQASVGAEYLFEEVKGLDLHDLRYDFFRDVKVGDKTKAEFMRWSWRRSEALDEAIGYLEGSGQAEVVSGLPVADARAMAELAREFERNSEVAVLPSVTGELAHSCKTARRSPTVLPTYRLSEEISRRVSEVVNQPTTTM